MYTWHPCILCIVLWPSWFCSIKVFSEPCRGVNERIVSYWPWREVSGKRNEFVCISSVKSIIVNSVLLTVYSGKIAIVYYVYVFRSHFKPWKREQCGRSRRFPVCAEVHPSKENHYACAGWYFQAVTTRFRPTSTPTVLQRASQQTYMKLLLQDGVVYLARYAPSWIATRITLKKSKRAHAFGGNIGI